MVAVEVIDDPSVLASRADPVCLLVATDDADAVRRAYVALGVQDTREVREPHRWRPQVTDRDEHLSMTLVGTGDSAEPTQVEVVVTDRVLLVVTDGRAADAVRVSVTGYERDTSTTGAAMTAALALSHGVASELAGLADQLSAEAARPRGFARSTQRRRMRRLRSQVFRLRSLLDLQTELLGPDEELHRLLPEAERPLLRRARSASVYARTTADQLYAGAGDVMAEQDSEISERLTLVSTVFLPLTVVTGFFGMNFAWLTARLESPLSFVLLGIVTPLLVTVATLVAVRRMGAGAPDR